MKQKIPFYPVLFGIFPILFLYAQNAREMEVAELVAPLLLTTCGCIALTVILALLFRSLAKGALLASVGIFLFFSFGHAVDIVPEFAHQMAESVFGPSLLVLIVFVAVLLLAARLTARSYRDLSRVTSFLNWLGLALVAFQIAQSGVILASRKDNSANLTVPTPIATDSTVISENEPCSYPDIYYIIVDGYGRSDVLRELYDFDNTPFISRLREMGFFVADSSYANYNQTIHSLGASLNMNYIDELGAFERTSRDKVPLMNRLHDNVVVNYLKERNYTTVVLAGGYGATDLKAADTTLTPIWNTNEFQNILISTTPLPLFAESRQSPYYLHRQRISYIFDKLPALSDIDSPKFVFAHIVCPHPPFVFDADGGSIRPKGDWSFNDGSHLVKDSSDKKEYIRRYRGQITHITSLLLKSIAGILESSGERPPVIIIQSDHGPGSELNWYTARRTNLRERFSILNAYYLPGLDQNPIYDEITPVNSFRVVLNSYFEAGLNLLPDRQFYASWRQPFTLQPVSLMLGGSAYTHLLDQFSSIPPDTLASEELSEPKKYGMKISGEGTHFLCEAGLCIHFEKIQRCSQFEICLDYNDDYQLRYCLGKTVVAADSVRPRWIKEHGMRIDTITVPPAARQRGFDNIVIYPSGGDGWFAVGHLFSI